MRKIVFKISMDRCKEKGFYNSTSTFLDLEKNLQKHFKISLDRCKEIGDVKLNELRKDKNIDEYREWIRNTKNYQKTSISLVFDLSDHIIKKYSLSDPNNEDGKKRFQDDYIFKEKNVSTEVSAKTPIASDINDADQPERVKQETYRILRDTQLARDVKVANEFYCQICGEQLVLKDGSPYAEAHHIKPLGREHNGPDVRKNILCVCPNHHALLDYGAIKLDPMLLKGIERKYIDYHNEKIFGEVVK